MSDKVFISYSPRDQGQARSLAQRLEANGLQPLLDQELFDLWRARSRAKDAPLNQILEAQLAESVAFVVFVDESSQWQQRELGAAMGRHWESRGEDFRIVPVASSSDDVPRALLEFKTVLTGNDPADEGWQLEVMQALGTSPQTSGESGPSAWSEEDQSIYKERLAKIRELARDDEAQRDREGESWKRFP